jgi:hypothetical protein
MENSASYLFLENLLVHSQLQMSFSEFTKLVDFLKHEGLITTEERQTLLDLARRLKMDEEPN